MKKFANFSITGSIPFSRMFLAGLFLAACGMATYAHFLVVQAGDDYTGWLMPLDRLFDLLLVAFLLALTYCNGRSIARKLGISFANDAEEISFSVMAGTGTLGLAILGFAFLGLLKLLPIIGLLLLLAFLACREAARLHQMVSAGLKKLVQTEDGRAGVLLLGTLATILLLRAAVPPYVADELIYHLTATKRFVDEGRIMPLYDISHGNMPFLIQMIYAVCLLAKADIAARLFSLAMALVTALGLYAFCARFLSSRTGIIALFAFFGAGMVVEVAVTTRIDVTLAGMLFFATYGMMVHLATEKKGWLYLSAILAGFALGIKLTAGLWIALLCVMYIAERLLRKKAFLAQVMKQVLVFSLIATVLSSPWLIKNLIWFHNPVYPFITGEVAEYGDNGPRFFSLADEARLDAHFAQARHEIPETVEKMEHELASIASARPERHPFRFWEYFTRGGDYNMAEPFHFPNYLFLLAPLSLVLVRNRWVLWLAILSTGFFIGSASSTWIARFLLPLYPPLTILSAAVLADLSNRLRPFSPIGARFLPGWALLFPLGIAISLSVMQMNLLKNIGFTLGTVSRHQFLAPWPDYTMVNSLPKESYVLVLGTEMSYYFRPRHIADQGWYSTSWRRLLVSNGSLEQVHEDLKRQGITHIFYNPTSFKFATLMGLKGSGGMEAMYPLCLRGQGPDFRVQLRNWATFELYSRKFLIPVHQQGGLTVFQLK